MDAKQWREEMERRPVLKGLLVFVYIPAGWFAVHLLNRLLHGPDSVESGLGYVALLIIVIWGYMRWGLTMAAQFPAGQITEWLWKLLSHLIRRRRIAEQDLADIHAAVFDEERNLKALAAIRLGTRAFFRAGIWIGVLAWLGIFFFSDHESSLLAATVFALVYAGWGYLWYRLGWHGWLPAPDFEG